jgi:hypothetical protein
MATNVEDILDRLVVLQTAITGVTVAHDETPENLAEFPCFLNYPTTGETTWLTFASLQTTHTFHSELHVVRGSLPDAEGACRPFINRTISKIMTDDTLNDLVDSVEAIRYTYGAAQFGGEDHLVISFEIDCVVYHEVGDT